MYKPVMAMLSLGSFVSLTSSCVLCLNVAMRFSTVAQVAASREFFGHPFLALILMVVGCVFHQLASAMTCRPVKMLYDFRYTSMLVVQLMGFASSVLFAYILGAASGTP
jgi:hypothetical protein